MAVVKTLIGNVKGPKGDKGAKGDTGAKGDKGATGQRGSRWTQGTKITGTSTTATIFSNSGISDALVNDNYLNTSTGNTYKCTVAGNASTAKWVYSGNIKGVKGDTGAKGEKGDTGATGPKGPQGEYAAVDSVLSKTSTNPIQNKAVAEELEKKLNSDGDSKDLTTTFTSNDSTNVTEWTDVGLLTSGEKHSSLFQKVATMFKNIRYLYHMLGTADISTLGEGADIGTVTGAISKLNSDFESKYKHADVTLTNGRWTSGSFTINVFENRAFLNLGVIDVTLKQHDSIFLLPDWCTPSKWTVLSAKVIENGEIKFEDFYMSEKNGAIKCNREYTNAYILFDNNWEIN